MHKSLYTKVLDIVLKKSLCYSSWNVVFKQTNRTKIIEKLQKSLIKKTSKNLHNQKSKTPRKIWKTASEIYY